MPDAINLFDRFGGVRPMAGALSEPPSTVQSWKTAGRVPATKQHDILDRALELGLDVQPVDVVYPLALRPIISKITATSYTGNDAAGNCDRHPASQRDAA